MKTGWKPGYLRRRDQKDLINDSEVHTSMSIVLWQLSVKKHL